MSSIDDLDEIFRILHPFCVDVKNNPFQQRYLDRLEEEILKLPIEDCEIWRCLFDLIVIPLRMCFHRAISITDSGRETMDIYLIKALRLLSDLVEKSGRSFNRLDSIPLLLSESLLLINYPPGSQAIIGSDDLIATVFDFTTLLLNSNSLSILSDNKPFTAQVVFPLHRCLQKIGNTNGVIDDSTRHFQESAIRCLSAILSLKKENSATFLPALASGLTLIIATRSIGSSSSDDFLIECLDVWTKLVTSANDVSENSTSYSDEWRRNSAAEISNVYDQLSSALVSHPSSKIRRILFDTASKIIQRGKKPDSILSECQNRSLEIMAAFVADDGLNVDLPSDMTAHGNLLEKLLISTCWRLPRSSKSPLSAQQRIGWQCLLGYLRLLKPDGVWNFLLVDENMKVLFTNMFQSIEFGSICEEMKPTSDVPEEKSDLKQRLSRKLIPLKYPSDRTTQQLVTAVCCELAKMDDICSLYDYFYQNCLSSSETDQLQAVFIFNQILASTSVKVSDSSTTSDMMHLFIDYYIGKLKDPDVLTPTAASLFLDGLGHCAITLKTDFQSSLINAFYVVLTLLRYPDYKDYVWAALFDFASALDHPNVLEMITANADYLSSSLTLRMRRLSLHPDAPSILASILDLVPWECAVTFRGTVMETLKAIDHYSSYSDRRNVVVSLLKVLERFCVLIGEKAPQESHVEDTDNETKSSPVWYISLIVDILQRIGSWIMADGIQTRMAALSVLDYGFKALAHNEDQLLPIIHQNWQPIVARLNDVLDNEKDERMIVVSSAAFRVLVTMARVSGNFISRRFGEKAWPIIRRILDRYLPVSKRANALVYSQCPSFNLQLAILENIGDICKKIDAPNELINDVMDICKKYESMDILPSLKSAANNAHAILK